MTNPQDGTNDDDRRRSVQERAAAGRAADRTGKELGDGDAAADPAEAERIAQQPDF